MAFQIPPCCLISGDCFAEVRIVEETAVRWGVRDDALGGRAVWAEVLTTEDALAEVANAASHHQMGM
ncbi:hypothetical protein [Nonomuraea basaltis]|uniref:hypothetical protein n=1 Tax=Nonomuraea basaltis TaxID=2495887 RepID=UPI00110C4B72|nr:hypothetical protein [Nonomuraea basaltis]TMR89973.1 hypothetical protein EJK15_57810 [Nonomuraea basaltis]